MERELLLALKINENSTRKINVEINTIKRFLPFVESFSAFLLNYEVFDLKKHSEITKTNKLKGIFDNGVNADSYYCLICKN
jgi:hypothetical protein